MKNIRAAAAVWCILGVAYCGSAPGETAGETAAAAPERPAPADSSATAAIQYREAEPVLRAVERERPRPAVMPDTPQREIRVLVDALLLTTAAFTVFAFLGMRKSRWSEYEEETVYRGKGRRSRRRAVESPPPVPESRAERERLPQSPRERAERLKARRVQLAAEIERLMKRV